MPISPPDELVKIDSADVLADFLSSKLLPGTNVTFTISSGPSKTLTINAASNPCLPVVVNIGAVGGSFIPLVPRNTTIIKGTVGDRFNMSNLIINDGVVDGLLIRIELTQTGSGGNISAWDTTNFVGSDLLPLSSIVLSVGDGKTDIIVVEWDDTCSKWMVVGFHNGIDP